MARINIFHQFRGFFSMVFEGEYEFMPTHVSLYMFLLNQNNRTNWTEWFKCPADTAMMGALIRSNKTYYKVLGELEEMGLIEYQRGKNNLKSPRIRIIDLSDRADIIPKPEYDTSVIITQLTTLLTTLLTTRLTTPLATQVATRLATQLATQLTTHKDILVTSNIKLETGNSEPPFFEEFQETETVGEQKNFRNQVRYSVHEIFDEREVPEEGVISEAQEKSYRYMLKLFDQSEHGFSEDLQEVWKKWLRARADQKQPYSRLGSMQSHLDQLKPYTEAVIEQTILQSIRNEWKDLFPDKIKIDYDRNQQSQSKQRSGQKGPVDLSGIYQAVSGSSSK